VARVCSGARRAAACAAVFVLVHAVPAVAQFPVTDSGARRLRYDPNALRSGQFVYEITLERDAGTTILGSRTVSASITMYAGTPAWLLYETRLADGGVFSDSLFTDLSLRPMHWASILGSARLVAEFRGDTVYGATSAPPGRRSMIGVVPAGAFVSAAMLETVLRLLPLNSAFEDSAATVSVTPGSNAVVPTRLAVIGEDRVRVPAGTFDCWVVSVRADPGRSLYWVTKQDPIVVRSAMDVPTLGNAQLIYSLTRIGR
jgi:hypothetical protein